jgi:N-acyl-D-aspartate/D-glutamate deacylase
MDPLFGPAMKVTAAHLARDAYLYIRQSSLKQVLNNTESTMRQYGLKERTVALGWPADRIHVIDTDQGQSGASAADRGLPAAGYRRRHGTRRDRAGTGGLQAGPQQHRLA